MTRVAAAAAALALFGVLLVVPADPALAHEATYYLYCPLGVHEGDSFSARVVRVADHDHEETFHANFSTEARTATSADFTGVSSSTRTSSAGSDVVAHWIYTTDDALEESDEQFRVTFTPPNGFHEITDINDPDRDAKCDVTIFDDDRPSNVTDVSVISQPGRDNNTYGRGEKVEIELTFDRDVDTVGPRSDRPELVVKIGERNCQCAYYERQPASNKLVFAYTVQPDDVDTDGLGIVGVERATSTADDDGWNHIASADAIVADDGTVLNLRFDDQENLSEHKLRGSLRPEGVSAELTSSPAQGDNYRYGETMEFAVEFTAPLVVEGDRWLSLRVDGGSETWRAARYASGSGTKTLTFNYTVQPGDRDTDGAVLVGTWTNSGEVRGWGGGGSLKTRTGRYRYGNEVLGGSVTPTVPRLNTGGSCSDGASTTQSDCEAASGTWTHGSCSMQLISHQPSCLAHGGTWTPASCSDGVSTTVALCQSPVWTREVTVDGRPYLKSYNVLSTPQAAADTYGRQETFRIAAVFDQPVDAGDTATVMLNLGSHRRGADVESGSGTDTLVFAYTFVESDRDNAGGFSASVLGISNITAAGTQTSWHNGYVHAADALTVQAKVNGSLDAVGPTVESVGLFKPAGKTFYSDGDTLTAKAHFSEGVTVTGTPRLALDIGGVTRYADAAVHTSGDHELEFSYRVVADDADDDGVSIAADSLELNGGTIVDAAGNAAELDHLALDDDASFVVDNSLHPTAVRITSTPQAETDTYGRQERIEIEIEFDRAVVAADDAEIIVAVGGDVGTYTQDVAAYVSGSGTDTLTFAYTVRDSRSDPDGITVRLRAGQDITDADTGDAYSVRHPAAVSYLGPASGHKIDSDLDVIAPTVTSIAIGSTPEGTAYVLDESVYIDVTFSENVFSTRNSDGAIGQVGIDIAGVTRDADYHRRRGGDTLRFRYRVVLGDVDAGGISIAENSLTLADGASLTDWRDNAAVLDHDALSDDADHAVNGPGGF